MKYLVIVEAPNKIKKVSEYFNKADKQNEYNVQASVGHIMDLDKSKMSIDLTTFTPEYIVSPDKINVVKNLKDHYMKCDEVLIASDADAEGCAIAWSIAQALKLKKPKRVIYHEITEKAIKNALKNLVDIDMDLFHSQQARRMLDRIIGYKISPILWKALNGAKSSGRVQSVVVRMVCEKEKEIEDFMTNLNISTTFKTKAELEYDDNKLSCELHEEKDGKYVLNKESYENIKDVMKKIKKSGLKIEKINKKEKTQNPSQPFTTDTLIQTAHSLLHFTTAKTTELAQKLYADGLITYIRTDSPNISESVMKEIKEVIEKDYGKEYYKYQQYKSKDVNAQCAHECIRPTHIDKKELGDKYSDNEKRLYDMIWKRTVASQMQSAKFDVYELIIDISKLEDRKFLSELEKCIFDGFLILYNKGKKDKIPEVDTELTLNTLIASQEYKTPPTRFDDATIVSQMKKLGIGRPSTYNSTVKKIQDIEYVKIENNDGIEKDVVMFEYNKEKDSITEKTKKVRIGKDSKKFVPTELGKKVNEFLVSNFSDILEYKFTAKIEKLLDKISEKKITHVEMLKDFYKEFEPIINELNEKYKDAKNIKKDGIDLGVHPDSKNKIFGYEGKYGLYIEMVDEDNKVLKTGPYVGGKDFKKIKMDDMVEILKYPKELGKYEKKKIKLCKGKYGLYLEHDKVRYTLKDSDGDIDLEKATKVITDKKESDKQKILWTDKDKTYTYTLLNGQYGKYICMKSIKTNKTTNVKYDEKVPIAEMTISKVSDMKKKSYEGKKRYAYAKAQNK